jgi:hypothetical protein
MAENNSHVIFMQISDNFWEKFSGWKEYIQERPLSPLPPLPKSYSWTSSSSFLLLPAYT